MPESGLHRRLIVGATARIRLLLPTATIITDLSDAPGTSLPPSIGSFRPDVYARDSVGRARVIAEAKTRGLDSAHTERQVAAFLRHLDESADGLFILAVPGAFADRAKSFLRFLQASLNTESVRIAVFDELDLWFLEQTEGRKWHLA